MVKCLVNPCWLPARFRQVLNHVTVTVTNKLVIIPFTAAMNANASAEIRITTAGVYCLLDPLPV
jgi:hypothetical protein